MLEYEDVIKITKKFSVLYVEDDECVASQTTQILSKFFKVLHYAKNGLDGYLQFLQDKPDLIITDIKMPQLDGMQMSAKIRETDFNIPIIIISAYDELSFLHKAIDLGIASYLTKPISNQNVLNVLFYVCSHLENERLAIEYKKEQMIREFNTREENAVAKLVDIIDTPIALCKNENIFYANSSFKELFSIYKLDEFMISPTISHLESITIAKDGYVGDIKNIALGLVSKIMIKNPSTKFYEVQKKKILIHNDTSEIYLYMFYDITNVETSRLIIEYQKNKLKNMNSLLSELFYKGAANKTKNQSNIKNNTENVRAYSGLFSEEQISILEKSRTYKTIALEYVAELDKHIIDDIIELRDIETEVISFIDLFIYSKNNHHLKSALNLLREYAMHINTLMEFGDIALAIKGLADFLLTLSPEIIAMYDKKIVMNINNLISDLTAWRQNIFEDKIANDIHYLDASIFSSCLQLEFEISSKQGTESDDDLGLELF